MANQNQLAIIRQGSEAWNRWRRGKGDKSLDLKEAVLRGEDLNGVDLHGADLSDSDLWRADLNRAGLGKARLRRANLRYANLRDANLRAADLSHALLHGADLTGTDLRETDFTEADLTGANLSGVDLRGANLESSDLYMVNFSGANLSDSTFDHAAIGLTTFAGNDLSSVHGLETLLHKTISRISIDTLYQSRGRIPDRFLQGAGVPEDVIIHLLPLIRNRPPIQWYSCFISYSAKDQEFADRLHTDLQAKGVRCWLFSEDAKWGETIWGEIDQSIRLFDKLIVVCSEHSLQSPAVLREIERALQREDREKKDMLFPIRIDDYVFDKWEHSRKLSLVHKVVGDFCRWKDHDAYQKSLARLLKHLQAADSKKA
jgi:hypothetical protein